VTFQLEEAMRYVSILNSIGSPRTAPASAPIFRLAGGPRRGTGLAIGLTRISPEKSERD